MVIVCEISVYCSTKTLVLVGIYRNAISGDFQDNNPLAKRLVLVQLAYVFSKASFLKVSL